MAYVFDTSTLLEAKNRYYTFTVCPAFWDWLVLERSRGNVVSVAAVRDELQDPDAKKWADDHATFFDANNDSRVARVSDWVAAHPHYTPAARHEFLRGADPRVISYALANGCTLVTQESSAPLSKRSVKIPDVCDAIGVVWKDTFEVLDKLSARFILDASP